MFKTNEELINNIPDILNYDAVLRLRIDCDLEYIEIPETIHDNVYYAVYNHWNLLWDNLGLAKPKVFINVWNTNNLNLSLKSPEEILTNKVINDCKYVVNPLNFKVNLYQSNEKYFRGVEQWSKRNRTFEYKNGI